MNIKVQGLKQQQIFTPKTIIDSMLDLISWDASTTWLEPSAGDGAFIRELIARGVQPEKITAIEIDTELCSELSGYCCNVINGCFFAWLETNKTPYNVVIGNPPYNIPQSLSPYYNKFIEAIIDRLTPDYFSFIIPSRWMVCGKGLGQFRNRMMNDRRMKKIVHFAGDKEVFKTVSVTGGVNYFLFENDYNGECEFVNGNTTTKRFLNTHDIIIQDNNAFGILEKVLSNSSTYIESKCSQQKPFGIRTNFTDFRENGIKCMFAGQNYQFVSSEFVNDRNNIISKWKVCISVANGSAQIDNGGGKRVIADAFLLDPNTVCSESYIVVNVFDSKKEAENFISYMKTKLFRFMLSLRMCNQLYNKGKFSFVPDMLDYSAPWSDAELYKKFGLTRHEIAYIESKIKAIM